MTPLAELYVGSYLHSCKLYSATAEAMGIDPVRVQYRQTRREVIREIVRQRLHGEAMTAYIQGQTAKHVPESYRTKFLTDLHTDLANLAPFSIAGMGISQQELAAWQQGKQ